jgi:3D (Asp-Asp-Asp) domain-containing protein
MGMRAYSRLAHVHNSGFFDAQDTGPADIRRQITLHYSTIRRSRGAFT